jgi:lipopolysaccharide export system protein LptA
MTDERRYLLAAFIFAIGAFQSSPPPWINSAVGATMFNSDIIVRIDDPDIFRQRGREASDDFITTVKPEFYGQGERRTPGPIIDDQTQTPEIKDFFGLLKNRGQPLEIEADQVERDDKGVERYGKNGSWVKLRLGNTIMKSRFLTIHYECGMKSASETTGELRKAGLAHILRIEASGNVLLSHRDLTAVGNSAVFDVSANKLWLKGNVVLTQQQSVTVGGSLYADIASGRFLIGPQSLWDMPRKSLKEPYPPVFEIPGKQQ